MNTQTRIAEGMEIVARAVRTTYGPGGRPAALDRAAGLTLTRDGLTVVREVRPDGPARLGADLVLEACARSNERAGDGTSATALVAAAAMREAVLLVSGGHPASVVGRQMREAARAAVARVRDRAQRVESYDQVEALALRASGGDHLVAQGIRRGLEAAGEDGTIVVEAGMGREVEVTFTEGVLVRAGARSPDMIPSDGERSMEEPLVAVCHHALTSELDVMKLLEAAAGLGRSVVLFAPQVGGRALATLLLNAKKAVVRCVAVEVPGVGEWNARYLGDLAAATGADPCDPALGRHSSDWEPEWFGLARRCSVTAKRTLVQPPVEDSPEMAKRLAQVRQELDASSSAYDRDRHAERLASLAGALCVLRVGGTTEPEARERRTRVEDAVMASQAALHDGYALGAGCAYLAARSDATDLGSRVVNAALEAPARAIADALGVGWGVALERVGKLGARWAGEEAIDSVASVTEAIQNGVAAAASGIECERVIQGGTRRGRLGS